jgi:hypothetical protein
MSRCTRSRSLRVKPKFRRSIPTSLPKKKRWPKREMPASLEDDRPKRNRQDLTMNRTAVTAPRRKRSQPADAGKYGTVDLGAGTVRRNEDHARARTSPANTRCESGNQTTGA